MNNDKTTGQARHLRSSAPEAAKRNSSDKTLGHALATGLDILEYLANCQHPATLAAISKELQVTDAVVNRSIALLEDRGYVVRNAAQSYERTGKLPEPRSLPAVSLQLLTHAQPIMRDLCEHISQSCNIALPSETDLQVIAYQESPAAFSISVPIGYRYDIPDTAAGLAFVAFGGHATPGRWPEQTSAILDAQAWSSLRNAVQTAAERGFAQVENPFFPDITDLSCPVYQDGRFVAVLTVPFMQTSGSANLGWSIAALQMAAERLSQSLQGNSLVA